METYIFRCINPRQCDCKESDEKTDVYTCSSRTNPMNCPHVVILKPTPKDLLTVGRVVELRNGMMAIIMDGYISGSQLFVSLNAFNSDLVCRIKREHKGFDIMAIYDAPFCGENTWRISRPINKSGLVEVWKREEKSQAQIEKEAIKCEMEKLSKRLEELEVK